MASEPYFDDYDIAPYDPNDPSNEPHPDHVVHQEPFRRLKMLETRAVGILRDPLVNSKYQNPTTEALKEEFRKRVKRDLPEQTMFAVCGDMGLGKSSLINSLLSTGTIARSGAGGGSCTWVVQRFMKPFAEQGAPFAAKVYLFPPERIRKIMASLLAKYFRATDHTKYEDDEQVDSEEMRSDNFTEKRSALDTFAALFGDKAEFADDDAAELFLSKAKSETDEIVLDELTSWADSLAASCLGGHCCITVEGSTVDELLYELQPYTYQLGGEEGKGQACPWPLVRVIEFGLNNRLLNEGIVLVDTPGLSDADSTRAANAARHHRKCTHKITVACVTRAKDDKALRDSLQQGYHFRRSAGTLLALTNGDSIDNGTEVGGSLEEKEKEKGLHAEIKSLRQQRSRMMIEKKQKVEQKPVDREALFEIDEKLRNNSSEIRSKVFEWEHHRVCIRNIDVAKAVSEHYRKMTPDPHPLSVFVVGNQAYETHQAGYTVYDRPLLTVEETGIPGLRARILNLPAEGKLNDALHLAEVQLPNLINFLELYCSKTHMARKDEIEAIIRQPTIELGPVLQKYLKKLRAAFEKRVSIDMKITETEWTRCTRKLCQKWALLHRSDGLALMKRHGCKKGRKGQPDISWNNELLQTKCVTGDLEKCFRTLQKEFHGIHEDLVHHMTKMLDSTRLKVGGNAEFNIMALQPLLNHFPTERLELCKRLKEAFRDLRKDAADVHQDTAVASPTSYLVEAMAPIYDHVITIKGGRDGPTRRMNEFERRISHMSGVWMTIHDHIEADLDQAFLTYRQSVETAMLTTIANIQQKFNILCEDVAIKDPVEKEKDEKLQATMKGQIKKARALLDGEISEAVAECKAWGKGIKDTLFVGDDE